MLKRLSYTLGSPEVLAVKALYEERQIPKTGMPDVAYDVLWNLFLSNATYASIARSIGSTRQAVHKKYRLYFEMFLGERESRVVKVARENRAERRKQREQDLLKKALDSPSLKILLAWAAGKYTIEPVANVRPGVSSKHPWYRMNGELRRAHRMTTTFRPKESQPQLFVCFQVSGKILKDVSTYTCIVDIPEDEFIYLYHIPTRLLHPILRKTTTDSYTLYIPYKHIVMQYKRRCSFNVAALEQVIRREDIAA